jgi:hypothetical protein
MSCHARSECTLFTRRTHSFARYPELPRDEKSCLETSFLSLRQLSCLTETRNLSQRQLSCLRDKFLVSETKKLVSETTFLSQRQLSCLGSWFHLVGIKHKQRQESCLAFFVSVLMLIMLHHQWQALAQDLPSKLHRTSSSSQHNHCFPECVLAIKFFLALSQSLLCTSCT